MAKTGGGLDATRLVPQAPEGLRLAVTTSRKNKVGHLPSAHGQDLLHCRPNARGPVDIVGHEVSFAVLAIRSESVSCEDS